MGNDLARRLFLGALIACFGLLMFIGAQRTLMMGLNAEVRHPRENMSMSVERADDGIIYVRGEGRLSATDLLALVEGLGNKNDVTDLIIGDGITELGFNAINSFEGLRTVWLGRDMQTVANGSFIWCTALEYVFLPKRLERAGKDFLYFCNNCRVITDASEGDLPRMKNVRRENVLYGIDSRDALLNALGEDAELPEALKQWWP